MQSKLKVISMVPSWTETLVEAGVPVVGRTRFCVHPAEQLNSIPSVGGTKNWNFEQVLSLKPDFLVLDQEENPKLMAEQQRIPYLATHVTSVWDMPKNLKFLGDKLENKNLLTWAEDWARLLMSFSKAELKLQDWPGVIEWGRRPTGEIKKIIYVIWKNPWIAVSTTTFIGSMWGLLGKGHLLETYLERYPQISLENISEKESTLLLFSSEPFPFFKKREGLEELGCPYAFVDGESFSWFGIRSLRFLQKNLV